MAETEEDVTDSVLDLTIAFDNGNNTGEHNNSETERNEIEVNEPETVVGASFVSYLT